MSRPIVAVLDVLPQRSRDQIQEIFATQFDLLFADGSQEQRVEIARHATALLAGWDAVDSAVVRAAVSCRLIQKLGVGTDRIDVAAAQDCGIPVLRAAGVNAHAVAEMTVLLTLAVLRRLVWAAASVREGRFAKEELRLTTYQLAGKTVGLVGAGYAGRAAAKRFASFDADLTYYDVRRLSINLERKLKLKYQTLAEVVATADVLSLHLPLTTETRGLFNSTVFASMKPSAILINTARGGLIDEEALIHALQAGHLSGAGLDVTIEEPLPTTSPLLRMENVLVTPHYGGSVADNLPRVVAHAFSNVTSVLAGRPVPPEDVVFWPIQ
jgi:phosphoglycerate dehydrogenase-like enzyme